MELPRRSATERIGGDRGASINRVMKTEKN
jgi:hypothetical protein